MVAQIALHYTCDGHILFELLGRFSLLDINNKNDGLVSMLTVIAMVIFAYTRVASHVVTKPMGLPETKFNLHRSNEVIIVQFQHSLSLYIFEGQKPVVQTVAFTTDNLQCSVCLCVRGCVCV